MATRRETIEYVLNLHGAEATRELKGVERAAKGAEAGLTGATRQLKDASRAARNISPALGKVSGALAGMGSPAGVAAVGLAALGVAAVAVGVQFVELITRSQELYDDLEAFRELDGFMPGVDAQTIASIEQTQASVDAVSTALKSVAVVALVEFGPAIRTGAELLIAFTLAVSDMATQAAEMVERFTAWHDTLGPLERTLVGMATGGLADGVATLGRLNRGLEDVDGATGDYLARARQLIGVQTQVNRAIRDGAAAAEDLEKFMDFEFRLQQQGPGTAGWRQEFEAEAASAEATRAQKTAETRQMFGAAGMVMTGDVMGGFSEMAALAGPIGAGVSAGVEGLVAIGQKGADQISADLQSFQDDLMAGIEALPEVVTEALPDLITGLVEAAPEIGVALAQAWWALMRAQLVDLPLAIAEGVGRAMANLWDRIKAFIERLRDEGLGVFRGDRDWQDRVKLAGRIGLAVGTLGASEVAIRGGQAAYEGATSRGAAPGMTFGGSRQPNVQVNVQTWTMSPDILEETTRQAQAVYGEGGLRSSGIYGGG